MTVRTFISSLRAATLTTLATLTALTLVGATAGAQAAPRWTVTVWPAKDGAPRTTVVHIHSKLPVDGWPGGFVPSLAVKCVDQAPSVFVATGQAAAPEAGKEGQFSVFYRLDNKPRTPEVWAQATSSDTLVAADSPTLLHELLEAKRFRFEFTPDHSTRTIYDFPVVGLKAALAKVAGACGSQT
jgi:hypothetical protein